MNEPSSLNVPASGVDPIDRFIAAWDEAKKVEAMEATPVTLATVGADGTPSARVVLLKGVDREGFTFFTNFESQKGRELAAHPVAALCFHWPVSVQQVRVKGSVVRVSDANADAYFATRPRGSQIGAWASKQSAPLESRDALVLRAHDLERQFADRAVPRPPFWGGFRVVPSVIEFWFGQSDRLHDRFRYTRSQGSDKTAPWTVERLHP